MIIHSPSLYSYLESVLEMRLGGIGKPFDAKVLLERYTHLKAQLDGLRKSGLATQDLQNLVEESSLLVEGFISNRSAFRYFGTPSTSGDTDLDDQLRNTFAQQLENDVEIFDQAFVDLDKSYEADEPLADLVEVHRNSTSSFTDRLSNKRDTELPSINLLDYYAQGFLARHHGNLNGSNHLLSFLTCVKFLWYNNSLLEHVTLPEILEEDMANRREKFRRFRFSFIRQCQLLRQVIQNRSSGLNQLSEQLQQHRGAWAAATRTMRQLSKLESPSCMGTLYFLCASKAATEVIDDGSTYLPAFIQDLDLWQQLFSEVGTAARLMWGADSSPQPQLPTVDDDLLLRLRESVAALVVEANNTFNFEGWSPYNNMNESGASQPRQPQNINSIPSEMQPHTSAREKKPPDPPSITLPQQSIQQGSNTGPFIFMLVTSIAFALVIYLMRGLLIFERTARFLNSYQYRFHPHNIDQHPRSPQSMA